jgi:hypothetical protein
MRRGVVGRFAAASILAVGANIWAEPLLAKHAEPPAAADQDAPTATPSESPKNGASTVITGEVVESKDLLSDADGSSAPITSGIEWSHKFTIALSGRNHIAEKWTNVRVSPGSGRGGKRWKRTPPSTEEENSATIGDKSAKAVWHVLGPKKLQRLFAGQHFLMMMTIEIAGDRTRHLEVRYLKQAGFNSIVLGDPSRGEASNYSLPQVQSATCTIQ